LRSLKRKKQCPKRLRMFMEFANIKGDLKQQAKTMKRKIRDDLE
jgi:hypothetical protein